MTPVDVRPTPDQPEFADIVELGRWIRVGETTPTRLAEYFLDRLARIGPQFNAVVTVLKDRARREARQAEDELRAGRDRGPLHGIPYGAKDLIATRDGPTSWGAAPFRQQRFSEDATVVRRLTEAGAVLCAKLAMVELAGGMGYRQPYASFTGPGRNPWNADRWSGGSSSGSGSAVAAGLVPFAIGSETWGSITTPAAFCGLSAVRPTYGRVSRHGAMALSWTLDKLGPMARSARDAGLVLAAIAGPDPADPTTLPTKFSWTAPPKSANFRIALFKDADAKLQPAVATGYRHVVEQLREVAELVTVEAPSIPCNAATTTILHAEMASAFEDFIGTPAARTLTAPEDRMGGLVNRFVLAKDYIRALRIRGKAIRIYADWLKPFDAVLAPSRATVAVPIDGDFSRTFGDYRGPDLGGPANLIGLPCVCVPSGFDEHGLPTGVQLLGRAGREAKLLEIACHFQQKTNWHRKAPAETKPSAT